MIDIVKISEKVLFRLTQMRYEKDEKKASKEQLIFPNKKQAKGDVKRISEQELRQLFIEEFKNEYNELFYSIETPTVEKYKFGKKLNEIIKNVDIHKISASLDMCVFIRANSEYKRILNIEFKNKNIGIEKIAKDILKLMREKETGAYLHLLKNTDKGTFRNKKKTGIFDMLYKSFELFKSSWKNGNKSIHILIFSIEQNTLLHRNIKYSELNKLDEIFFKNRECGSIKDVKGNGWILKPAGNTSYNQ